MTLTNVNAKKQHKGFVFNSFHEYYLKGRHKDGIQVTRKYGIGQEIYHVQKVDLFGVVRFTVIQDWKKDYFRYRLYAPYSYDIDRIISFIVNNINK